MTEIERKALALVDEVRVGPSDAEANVFEALCRSVKRIEALEAEVERLREALQTIHDHDGASYRYGDWVRETARAALEARHD